MTSPPSVMACDLLTSSVGSSCGAAALLTWLQGRGGRREGEGGLREEGGGRGREHHHNTDSVQSCRAQCVLTHTPPPPLPPPGWWMAVRPETRSLAPDEKIIRELIHTTTKCVVIMIGVTSLASQT